MLGVRYMRVGYRRKHTATIVIISLLCVLMLVLLILHTLLKRAEPVFVAQTSNYSNTAFTDLVNKSIVKISETEEFSDFFEIISKDGTTTIEADTRKINRITSKLLIEVQNTLNNDYPAKLFIPLGSLTNYYLLSSVGPLIPITIIPISIVTCNMEETFESAGINQVLHKIQLKIGVDMHYRGYSLDERERIETVVPIAETIISGTVPQYYGNGLIKTND